MLRKQLAIRFGPLEPAAEARIAAASPETLDRYVERILTAPSLDAVFVD